MSLGQFISMFSMLASDVPLSYRTFASKFAFIAGFPNIQFTEDAVQSAVSDGVSEFCRLRGTSQLDMLGQILLVYACLSLSLTCICVLISGGRHFRKWMWSKLGLEAESEDASPGKISVSWSVFIGGMVRFGLWGYYGIAVATLYQIFYGSDVRYWVFSLVLLVLVNGGLLVLGVVQMARAQPDAFQEKYFRLRYLPYFNGIKYSRRFFHLVEFGNKLGNAFAIAGLARQPLFQYMCLMLFEAVVLMSLVTFRPYDDYVQTKIVALVSGIRILCVVLTVTFIDEAVPVDLGSGTDAISFIIMAFQALAVLFLAAAMGRAFIYDKCLKKKLQESTVKKETDKNQTKPTPRNMT